MSPYFVTDPTFRLYELSGLIQELSKSNNPLSNLFCGEGWTKRSFFGLGSPTIVVSICLLLSQKNSRFKYLNFFLNSILFMYPWSQLLFLSLLFTFTHFFIVHVREVPYGLAVRIPGFHPGGRGSTPVMGTLFLSAQNWQVLFLVFIKHWG